MMDRHAWVVNAYNDFFKRQKSLIIEGQTCSVSTYFFNDKLRSILEDIPINDVPLLTADEYRPMRGTALYDSMITILDKLELEGTVVSSADETQPQQQKLFVVITDGMNNSGVKEASDLLEKINAVKVEIVYMGSNQDAILNGARIGAARGATLEYSDDHFLEAMDSIGNAVSRMRSGQTQGIEFTPLERERSSGGVGGIGSMRPSRAINTLSPLPSFDLGGGGNDLLPPRVRRHDHGTLPLGSSLNSLNSLDSLDSLDSLETVV
jgi:hypothetical protein